MSCRPVASQFRRIGGALVHETSYLDPPCQVGPGTVIRHNSIVRRGSRVGGDCIIGMGVQVGPDGVVGHRCRIQNHVSLYRGISLEDDVFCGPGCVFTNVRNPRADIDRDTTLHPTVVRQGATIGANATIVAGLDLGRYCFIAAGAVVTHPVPAFALMAGVPARRVGWVSHTGVRLTDALVCPETGRQYRLDSAGMLTDASDATAMAAPPAAPLDAAPPGIVDPADGVSTTGAGS